MTGPAIVDGVVVITNGKIAAVGAAADVSIPDGHRVLNAPIVTPGLIDARTSVGLTGILNYDHDQDQLESAEPMQPQLRAVDAYNARDELIDWIRSFGVTTVHTGHAPGEVISGQTMIVKLHGTEVGDNVLNDCATIAATISPQAHKHEGKSPGTRGKLAAMLRQELIEAQEYAKKADAAEDDKKPARDLKLEALGRVLRREIPLMVTADRAQDIATALRIAKEFEIKIWLDSGAESYLMIDALKEANVPVLVHPLMYRAAGERENLSMETPANLKQAGLTVAFTSGFEDYVPKVRVVLFEAAIAQANGLLLEQTLAMLTIDAAKILGIDKRVGSLEVGKDGDLALYDGNPFEYTKHCVGVVIDGEVVSSEER
ncbi:MAG: amidohydrolase family protein [Phycisphaerae bacterium]